jgi:hypothetical protein
VFDSLQWEECLLNTLANADHAVTIRGVVIVHNMILVNRFFREMENLSRGPTIEESRAASKS